MSDQNTSSATRTPEEIQAELEATRREMSRTVDQLVAELQPARIAEKTKEAAQGKVLGLLEEARAVIVRARQGDPDALRRVGYVAAGAAAVVGLTILRAVRRHRA